MDHPDRCSICVLWSVSYFSLISSVMKSQEAASGFEERRLAVPMQTVGWKLLDAAATRYGRGERHQ